MNYKDEEFLNAASHAIGIVLGIVGLFFLLVFNTGIGEYSTLSIWFYAISIIILYSTSTVYHAVTHVEWKAILRKIDHISIYILIAGTYTPVALITLEKGAGWLIFWIVWGIAALGTVLKIFFTGKFELFSLLLYLAMGWLIVFDFQELVAKTTDTGLNLLMAGGAFYTVGIIFYAIERIPYNHLIWHFFVLGGSICHYLFIFYDVI